MKAFTYPENKQLKNFEMTSVEEAEIIFVFGGDGTLLRAIKELNHKKHFDTPFFGVAGGTLNFLMNPCHPDELDIHKMSRLDCKAIKIQVDNNVFTAYNDVVFGNSIMGYHYFQCNEITRTLGDFFGAGICFANFIGSTGYNFNNNGHILPIHEDLISVTSVVANEKTNVILSANRSIDVKITNRLQDPCFLWIDGRNTNVDLLNKNISVSQGEIVTLAFANMDEFSAKRGALIRKS